MALRRSSPPHPRPAPTPDGALPALVLGWLEVPCAVLDAQFRHLFASPAYARAAGLAESALLGGDARTVLPWSPAFARALPPDPLAPGYTLRVALPSAQPGGEAPRALEARAVLLPGGAPGVFVRLRAGDGADADEGADDQRQRVGHLAASVAHHFNNLLGVVLHNVDVALAAVPPGATLRSILGDVRAAALRGEALTRQLLAFGRTQSFELRPLELDGVVEGAVAGLRPRLGAAVATKLELGCAGAIVRADAAQLEQALASLAHNACDAMPDGGTLEIATRPLELDAASAARAAVAPGRYLELCVRDTGRGMPAEVLARAFEPFFTTRDGGAGLGLAAAREIVAHHGGALALESHVGHGTTARVLLPRVAAPAAPEGRAHAQRKRKIVLLAEDEDLLRNATRRVLEISGFTVLTAADGAEALAICERGEQAIDVLLTDIVMPRMNGRELARAAHALRPALRIVFMTGYDATALPSADIASEASVLLRKPVAPAVLIATLRQVLAA